MRAFGRSDIPFVRLDSSPDSFFYEKPRLAQHLDTTALSQIEDLSLRLLPKGARILDRMSSLTSQIATDLEPERVTGLGMNGEELAANGLLAERVVQDLKSESRMRAASLQLSNAG